MLSDGTVLVTGGGGAQAEAASEIWDPRSGAWTLAAPLLSPRVKFGMVRFGDDTAVAFGGAVSGAVDLINGTSTSLLFTPALNLSALAPTIAPAVAPGAAYECTRRQPCNVAYEATAGMCWTQKQSAKRCHTSSPTTSVALS